MRCRKVRSFLSAYCHDELNSRRKLAVSEHLLTCSACRREEALYQQMANASKVLPELALSDNFNARLLNRIAQERFSETRTQAYLPKGMPIFTWRRMVPVALTACLAVFAVSTMLPTGDSSSPMRAGDSPMSYALQDNARLNDSYLTVQPVSNPNLTVNLEKDWSLDRQLARAERVRRISNTIIPASSFGGRQYQEPLRSQGLMTGQPVPYVLHQFRMRPVVKMYVQPQPAAQKGGVKPY